MKTILLTLTYAVGIGELILAGYFWVTNSKSEIRRVMALLAFSTGMWVLMNGLTSYTNSSIWIEYFLYALFVFGFGIVLLLVYLGLIYPYPIFALDRLHKILFVTIAAMYTYIAFFTKTIFTEYRIAPDNPGYLTPGPTFVFFQISITLCFFLAIYIFFYRLKRVDGPNKRNIKILLTTVLLGGVPAIALNMWAVFFKIEANPLLAVIPSVCWVLGTLYIIRGNNKS